MCSLALSIFPWVPVGFGEEPSDRVGLQSPYDKICFWRCVKCPSLNGIVSMNRHCIALLQALSFKEMYRSTAKPVNVLNTVACSNRQVTQVLSQSSKVDISDEPSHE